MPTELEELVDFISHGNTQIRQIAVENLVPYSLTDPAVFKVKQLLPITDLKVLVRDYKQIAQNALTILINLSTDNEILENLASDKEFMKKLLTRVTSPSEPNANEMAMLLANLSKSTHLSDLLTTTLPAFPELSSSNLAIDQLLDLFVRGASGTYNVLANYDYLSYLFADLAKLSQGRKYFLTRQSYDDVVPLTKLTVFTEHASSIRRKGVASTIKNVAFEVPSHPAFLSQSSINILPYLLLPITGNEEYSDEDTENMLEDLQLLPPDKQREADPRIIETHIETLMLLSTTREGRELMRGVGVYPVVRETHLRVEDEAVREACERLVQVLMRDEEGEEKLDGGMTALVRREGAERPQGGGVAGNWHTQEEEDGSDDDKIVEV